MSYTNFRVAYYSYAEIKHSDCLLLEVPQLFLTNQSAFFQISKALLLKNLFMTLLRVGGVYKKNIFGCIQSKLTSVTT